MTTRRQALVALGVSALAAPFGSFAQLQNKIWRIGFLSVRDLPTYLDADAYGGFLRGMRELGYVEGKNLVIEWRSPEGKAERLPDLAAELVRLKVDVLITSGTPASLAAQRATTTIPVVMVSVGDPVRSGLVKSLARPGGNITGTSNLAEATTTKAFDLLLDIAPRLSRVAVLVNPSNPAPESLKNLEAVAQKRRVEILRAQAQTPQEIDYAFSFIRQQNAGALIVTRDAFLNQQVRQIAALASQARLPTVAGLREYAEAGGLMSYGANPTEGVQRAAVYVDKIFKGAKPSDLPVEQPTKLELVINRKTAKALGLTIPQSLLISADRVIE